MIVRCKVYAFFSRLYLPQISQLHVDSNAVKKKQSTINYHCIFHFVITLQLLTYCSGSDNYCLTIVIFADVKFKNHCYQRK